MRVIRAREVKPEPVGADNAGNPAKLTSIQVLVPEGPNFVMRVLTVKPGGHTPRHRHDFEHEVYVLAGKGKLTGDIEAEIGAGDAVYVESRDLHCFENTGSEDMRFICVIAASAA